MEFASIKTTILTALGVIGGVAVAQMGGWDLALQTLVIFMAVDYITGLMVAGVFKQSKKTVSGALESRAGWKGLCRKVATLLLVAIAYRVDALAGTEVVRYAVIIGFVGNELISLTENVGLMGVNFPDPIKKAIDVLVKKGESNG